MAANRPPVYPCGCCPEPQDYCLEWWRLARQCNAAFDAYSCGALTWDEWHWFSRELAAHTADWSGWSD
jgi:hypothetical protein